MATLEIIRTGDRTYQWTAYHPVFGNLSGAVRGRKPTARDLRDAINEAKDAASAARSLALEATTARTAPRGWDYAEV